VPPATSNQGEKMTNSHANQWSKRLAAAVAAIGAFAGVALSVAVSHASHAMPARVVAASDDPGMSAPGDGDDPPPAPGLPMEAE
jgi:hypothetical protein